MNFKIAAFLVSILVAHPSWGMQKAQVKISPSSSFGTTIQRNPEYLIYAAASFCALVQLIIWDYQKESDYLAKLRRNAELQDLRNYKERANNALSQIESAITTQNVGVTEKLNSVYSELHKFSQEDQKSKNESKSIFDEIDHKHTDFKKRVKKISGPLIFLNLMARGLSLTGLLLLTKNIYSHFSQAPVK